MKREQLTNVETEAQCQEWALKAMNHCRQSGRALVKGGYRSIYLRAFSPTPDVAEYVAELADRIIAERTIAERAEECRQICAEGGAWYMGTNPLPWRDYVASCADSIIALRSQQVTP